MLNKKIDKLQDLFAQREEAKETLEQIESRIFSILEEHKSTGTKSQKPKKKAAESNTEPQKSTKKLKNKKWSLKHDKCVSCGTTERPHKTAGLCAGKGGCYSAAKVKELKNGNENKKVEDTNIKNYKCRKCDHITGSTLEYQDVLCVKCGSSQVSQV